MRSVEYKRVPLAACPPVPLRKTLAGKPPVARMIPARMIPVRMIPVRMIPVRIIRWLTSCQVGGTVAEEVALSDPKNEQVNEIGERALPPGNSAVEVAANRSPAFRAGNWCGTERVRATRAVRSCRRR